MLRILFIMVFIIFINILVSVIDNYDIARGSIMKEQSDKKIELVDEYNNQYTYRVYTMGMSDVYVIYAPNQYTAYKRLLKRIENEE